MKKLFKLSQSSQKLTNNTTKKKVKRKLMLPNMGQNKKMMKSNPLKRFKKSKRKNPKWLLVPPLLPDPRDLTNLHV